MDHPQAHAHPISSSHDTRPRQQAARARTFGIPHTPSPVQHDRLESLASPHQRRLQLRNAGFRGTQLSTHNISKRFSRLFHGNEEPQSAPVPGRPTNSSQENTTPIRRNIKSSRSYQSSLGILNEITNSTRNRYRKPIPIFEDNPERPLLEDSPAAPSPTYHETPSSPLVASDQTIGAIDMHLRELSGNEWRSPPPICDSSSESQKHSSIRVGSRRRVSSRKGNLVSPGYTEHIENLLQTSRAQAHSPQSGVPFKAKFEAAKMENSKLKEIIQELEDAFDERVKEAVEHMTSTEVELRRRVKMLEDEADQKSLVISELEYQQSEARVDLVVLDTWKATLEKLESEKQSLEDSNRSISRRNEVLTELLAISPTKNQQGLGFASPMRNGPRRNPRPQSMLLPRLPSSPRTRYTSRPRSLVASPAESPSFFSSSGILAEELEPADHKGLKLSDQISAEDLQSIDSGLGESCSTKSAVAQSSRRSTLASQRSTSPSCWGLPLPASPSRDDATVKAANRRKPRRFMAGSTQLKPLLLPSLAGDMISSQTSSLVPAPLSPTRRHVSDESLDPTISFLSHPYSSSIVSSAGTPSWLADEPLSVLDVEDATQMPPTEGQFQFQDYETGCHDGPGDEEPSFVGSTYASENASPSEKSSEEENEVTAILDRPAVTDDPLTTVSLASDRSMVTYQAHLLGKEHRPGSEITVFPSPMVPNRRELISSEYVESDQGSSVQIPGLNYVESPDNVPPGPLRVNGVQRSVFSLSPTPNPRKRRKSSWSSDAPPSSQASETTPLLKRKSLIPRSPGHQNLAAEALLISPDIELQSPQKCRPPGRCLSPLKVLQRQTSGSKPLASVTIQTIYGTLSQYTHYIREIKRDPTALARRVIANAWHANWKVLGRLSWWVLGLFIRPPAAREEGQAWDWEDYDAAGIADRIHQDEVDDRLRPPRSSQTSPERRVRFEDSCDGYRTRGSKSPARPVLKGGKEAKTSWGKSLYLWGKFSVAILLAVGGAMVKGPAEMLKDCEAREGPTSTSAGRRCNEERARAASQSAQSTPEMFAIPEQSPPTRPSFDFSMDFPTAEDDPGGGGSPGLNPEARQRNPEIPRSRLARPRSSGVRWVSRAGKGSKINLASSPTRSSDESSGLSLSRMNGKGTSRAGREFPFCEDVDAGNTLDPGGGDDDVRVAAHPDRVGQRVRRLYDPTSPHLPTDWGDDLSPSGMYPTHMKGEGDGNNIEEVEVEAVQKSLRDLRLT